MADSPRWRVAQTYERFYWTNRADQISEGRTGGLEWYEWRARRFLDMYGELLPGGIGGDASILEIGCGPVGFFGFLPGSLHVGIDPLERFFSESEPLTEHRPGRASYVTSVGERLPFAGGVFDLVIVDNCIDHVRSVSDVMREIARVLAFEGVVYFRVNCRSSVGYWAHRLLSRLALDPGHPHTFTAERFEKVTSEVFDEVILVSQGGKEKEAAPSPNRGIRELIKRMLHLDESVVEAFAHNG